MKWFSLQETFEVFADLFDAIIELQHGGYEKTKKHQTDLNPDKLVGGDDLDNKYVISCRARAGRSIRGFCLPPFCTRAERRAVEKAIMKATALFAGELKGDDYSYTICV